MNGWYCHRIRLLKKVFHLLNRILSIQIIDPMNYCTAGYKKRIPAEHTTGILFLSMQVFTGN
jgi:hypothetical protein